MEKKQSDLTFGKRNFYEFLEAGNRAPKALLSIREIILKDGISSEERRKINELTHGDIKISIASAKEIDKIAPGKNHQGYIIIKNRSKEKASSGWEQFKNYIEPGMGPLLILDRIQDPGNLGGILRTAECFGAKAVILSDRDTCPITDVVEKTSAGALHSLEIFRIANLHQCLEFLKDKEYWIVATDETGDEDWSKLPDSDQIALIMGNEGEGVKRILLETSDFQVRIPLSGVVSSLNVSVATGIAFDRIVNGN